MFLSIGVLLYLLVCFFVGFLGRNTKLGGLGTALASMLFTPLVTAGLLMLTKPKSARPNN